MDISFLSIKIEKAKNKAFGEGKVSLHLLFQKQKK